MPDEQEGQMGESRVIAVIARDRRNRKDQISPQRPFCPGALAANRRASNRPGCP